MAKSQAINIQKYKVEVLAGLLLFLVYMPTFFWMWDRWFARDSYYSHGILIPLVSAFLIWQKREKLQAIKAQPSAWGVGLFLAGIAIHLLSALFRLYFTSGFSLILVLFGLVLHFYGKRAAREVAFPLVFLVFMVPLPLVVVTNISFRLKLMAAHLAVIALNNMRIPCLQDGSTIILQHARVLVDEVCGGLRSLISLAALGALFAYWMKAGRVKKALLFVSTIPIAVITNVARIAFLAIVSEIWGPQFATGFVHEFSGLLVFALAFILLYAVAQVLE